MSKRYDIPHPHIELPSAFYGWLSRLKKTSYVVFLGIQSPPFSCNRKILAGKASSYNVNLAWEEPVSGFFSFYQIYDAAKMIYFISSLDFIREVGHPCNFCIGSNVIGENSLKHGFFDRYPVTMVCRNPIRVHTCVDGSF